VIPEKYGESFQQVGLARKTIDVVMNRVSLDHLAP
jgi:hypothetical protein